MAQPMAQNPQAMAMPIGLQQSYDQQRKRNTAIIAALAIIAVLSAVFIGLRAAGLLGAGFKGNDTNALVAARKNEGAVLQTPGKVTPPALEKIAEAPAEMPKDIEDWLKHLEKCEAEKVNITGDQYAEALKLQAMSSTLGAGMGTMNPYDQSDDNSDDKAPGSYTKGKVLDFRPRWQKLQDLFHSYPPPAECQPIADDFDRALGEIPGMMGDISEILNTADSDPTGALQKIKKLQNSSYGDIDRYFIRCDEKVARICGKYNKKKWFNIKGDVMAGGSMAKLSP